VRSNMLDLCSEIVGYRSKSVKGPDVARPPNVVMIMAPNVFSTVWRDRSVVHTLHGCDSNVSEELGAFRVARLVCQSFRRPAIGCYVDEQAPHARSECSAFVDVSMQRGGYLAMITDHGYDFVHDSIPERGTEDPIC
jgi:hypothetical protein